MIRVNEKTSVLEIRRRALQLYMVRVICVLAVLPAYYLASRIAGFTSQMIPLLLLGAGEIILNAPYRLYFKKSDTAFKFLAASVLSDFMVETLAVHFIGGIDAMFFSAIYLISIVYCAMFLPGSLNFLMATMASLLYSGLIAAEYFDIIPRTQTLGLQISGMDQIAIVVSHVAFFYLMSLLAHFLIRQMEVKEKKLQGVLEDLHEANNRIKYAHRMKSEFIAHMSHELRSPLNAISGFASLLREENQNKMTDRQRSLLGKIELAASHLLELINDVLDISKLEARRFTMDWSEADLAEIIRTSVDLFYEEAMRRQVRLIIPPESESKCTMPMDPRKVRQILYNLLSNAIKFTPPGGEIIVKLERLEKSIRVSVADTGIGINEADQKKIFTPFEQAGRATSEEMQGTGLGLAITQKLVELHGGKVHLESMLGKGSRFMVDLPLPTSAAHRIHSEGLKSKAA